MPKKSESIELRLPYETKQAFMARCQARGVTASAELRGFIDAAIEPAPVRKSRFAIALPVGVLLGAVLEAAIVSPTFAHADAAASFARMDANRDGRVTFAEFSRESDPQVKMGDRTLTLQNADLSPTVREVVLRDAFARIDTNHDGVISFDEFNKR
jgi:hypothetical protein